MRNHLLLLLVLREIRSVKRLTFGLFFIAYSIKRRDLSSTSFSARFEVKWSASSIIRSFGESVVCTSCHCLIHSSSSLVLRVILLAIQIAFSRELIHRPIIRDVPTFASLPKAKTSLPSPPSFFLFAAVGIRCIFPCWLLKATNPVPMIAIQQHPVKGTSGFDLCFLWAYRYVDPS